MLQLQKQAARCSFGAELDNYLQDGLVVGINDAALQEKMLLEKRPTFSSLRTLCGKFEALKKRYGATYRPPTQVPEWEK